MAEQIILAVDEQGNFSGEYIAKEAGHQGQGKKHLAIAVLLYNLEGEVLLQRRKHQVFDNIWDLTGATHPLHTPEGDETLEEATWRCLEREYGIKEKIPLRNLGFFDYFAKYGDLCENEHCAFMIGEYSGEVKLNPEVGYGCERVDKDWFLKDMAQNPLQYTPWAVEAVKLMKNITIGQGS